MKRETEMTISKENAEEYSQTLAQHMCADWRQIELADALGIWQALGFKSIGNWVEAYVGGYMKLTVNKRQEAVAELKAKGKTQREIAGITGVDQATVSRDDNANASASVPDQENQAKLDAYASAKTKAEAEAKKLKENLIKLVKKAESDEKKHQKAVGILEISLKNLHKQLDEARTKAKAEAWEKLTDQEKERARKEADAFADEEMQKLINAFASLLVKGISSSIQSATDGLQKLQNECKGGIPSEYIAQIETIHVGLIEQLNIARMSEMSK